METLSWNLGTRESERERRTSKRSPSLHHNICKQDNNINASHHRPSFVQTFKPQTLPPTYENNAFPISMAMPFVICVSSSCGGSIPKCLHTLRRVLLFCTNLISIVVVLLCYINMFTLYAKINHNIDYALFS